MPKLTKKTVDSLKEPGMYGDGHGLYLRVGPNGAKSWILRTMVHGRRRELGLGSTLLVSLAEARDLGRQYLKIARQGGDPSALRKRELLTFEEAARRVHQNLLPTWTSVRHGEIWWSSLEKEVFPHFGNRPIDTIGTADILKVLTPVWTAKHDTARRLKQRIATVFDWAKGAGHYREENPVNGVTKALPSVKHQAEHMKSLPWQELPGFMQDLQGREGMSDLALYFIILTATRSSEARKARWNEIKGDVWTVPAERMKTRKPHRVPLSKPALAILDAVRGADGDLIFPSSHRDPGGRAKPMSDPVFKRLFERMGRKEITTHGFRTTFRMWCSESARADREVAETALAHKIGNKVEQAYSRSDLFERRRELMEAWARFATGQAGDVVQMLRA